MHDNCVKCKLHTQCQSPFMEGSGAEKPNILFIGEAPGAEEDDKGEPFVGRSGKLLRDVIEMAKLDDHEVGFTNTIRCRPPDNRNPKANEVKLCSHLLTEELVAREPKVVVLLGNAPLKAVLGQTGIMNWNGQAIDRDGITYVPAYHPSYILRNGSRPDLLEEWMGAFNKAVEIVDGKQIVQGDSHYDYRYPKSLQELEEMRDYLLEYDGIVAYDVESMFLNIKAPDNAIISVAFATHDTAWSFPLDHEENDWSEDEWNYIVDGILEPVLTECRIIGHNVKFDCKITRELLAIDFEPYGDTLQLHRMLNAHHLEHGLKRLAGMYLDMFDYDRALSDYIAKHDECNYKKGGHYGNVPLKVLLPYGGKDVAATHMLDAQLFPQLSEEQQHLYLEMVMQADYALGVMEQNGMLMDQELARRYQAVYTNVMDGYYDELVASPYVKRYIEHRQDLLDEDYELRLEKSKTKRLKRPAPFRFNPNSSQQVAPVLYDYAGFDPPGYTDTGNPSVKRDLLKEVAYDIKDNPDFGEEEISLLDSYMDWKLISGVLSKTFKPMLNSPEWLDPDGRVRSTYILGGAKTGRSASRNPNLQNIPTPEKEPGTILYYLPVKNVFTFTHKGGCLCMVDYAGMELRVMASVANIKGMADTFAAGGDVHRYVSSLIYGISQEEITKEQRYRGKWCNWSLLYLGSWWTLYRLYRINGLTEDEAKRIANLYFEAFPELETYHRGTIEFLEEHKYIQSPFGRTLQIPAIDHKEEYIQKEAQRTAVNMPIQGTASDTLMVALAIINHHMQKERMKTMLVNTVHDSIVADVYPGELNDFQVLCVDVMENVVGHAADHMPHINFDWLKVPLKADVDVGTHYGSYGFPKELTCTSCNGSNFVFSGESVNMVKYQCMSCGNKQDVPFDSYDTDFKLLYNQTHPMAIEATERLAALRDGVIVRKENEEWNSVKVF